MSLRPRKTGSEFCCLVVPCQRLLNGEAASLKPGEAGKYSENTPYTVRLSIQPIKGANVLPVTLLDADDILDVLDDGSAEVESEVCAIVVASRRPRFVSRILGLFLALGRHVDVYRVQVEEGARRGRANGTRQRLLAIIRRCCENGEREREGIV